MLGKIEIFTHEATLTRVLRTLFTNLFAWMLLFAIVPFTHAGPSKSVKDWFVYCSDGLTCNMSTDAIEGNIYSFQVERGTDANALLNLAISFDGEFVPDSIVRMRVKKTGMDFSLPVASAIKGDYQWQFDLGKHSDTFLAGIKAGKNLTISVQTDKGNVDGVISLSGVVASLLFIDEAQGRVGRTDALQAVGDKPAIAVTTRITALKKQTDLPKSVHSIWANEYAECSDDGTDIIERFGASRVDIDKESRLYLLPCNFPGAYNMPYIAVAHNIGSETARRISFPVIGSRGPTNMDTAYNVEWIDKLSRLSAFFKGRGIGDCGSRHLWEWDGDGLYGEFELIEERLKDDCDEKLDDFPLIWPPD